MIYFLDRADKTDLLVTRLLDMSNSFASSMESLATPRAHAFQDSLHFEHIDNLLGTARPSRVS